MKPATKNPKKAEYFLKLESLVGKFSKILIVEADHVGSRQMAEVRHALRGKAVVLMGKNTMIRRALSRVVAQTPQVEALIQAVKLNIGFVFCDEEPTEVRKIILDKKTPELARQGVIAPCDVFVQPGGTGLDPSQTSFFQALGIATKIVRSQIEIQSQVHLIKEGEKVSASAASLLQKLNVKPFTYGLIVKSIYDNGDLYDASILDLSTSDVMESFKSSVNEVAALSLALDYPSAASISHTLIHAFKNCAALVLQSDYVFPEMEPMKNLI
ncbi:ribosomal protein RPP0 [Cardiosporidium cionae]|uniref:Ribosomal protein RPP0 n=1 Tax=Cardiosporidium cionae TaxID=476202 RepID=A0ABQ7J5M4_9APIC|nr:ribosomal protein RPP0 [Cardiosporidium cionae]|eukprot:KAF8819287.1 ribosomal protein RPP0 [Cardiosporidium cionae]